MPQIYPKLICPDWIPFNLTLCTSYQVGQCGLTWLTLFPSGDRELDRGTFRETQRGMAVEEKPGVKSSSSIVPCFLFVEVRNMNELSVIKKKMTLNTWRSFPRWFFKYKIDGQIWGDTTSPHQVPLSCWCKIIVNDKPGGISGRDFSVPSSLDHILVRVSLEFVLWFISAIACPVSKEKPLCLWDLTHYPIPPTWCTFLSSHLCNLSLSGKYFRLNSTVWDSSANTRSATDIPTRCHTSCPIQAPGAAGALQSGYSCSVGCGEFSSIFVNCMIHWGGCGCHSRDRVDFQQLYFELWSCVVQIMPKVIVCGRQRMLRETHQHGADTHHCIPCGIKCSTFSLWEQSDRWLRGQRKPHGLHQIVTEVEKSTW